MSTTRRLNNNISTKFAFGLIILLVPIVAIAQISENADNSKPEVHYEYQAADDFILDLGAGYPNTDGELKPLDEPVVTTQSLLPYAGASLSSISAVGGGRYDISGFVTDQHGNPTCGLAMASGRCVFTCGPGSLRCEGGIDNLSIGQFELFNLPTEANGNIILQAFVGNHIAYTGVIPTSGVGISAARWGVSNGVCCQSSVSRFSVSVDGVIKGSVAAACPTGSGTIPPTWEGWADTAPGHKLVTASLEAAQGTCPSVIGQAVTFDNWLAGRCYLVYARINSFGNVSFTDSEVDCLSLP